MRLAKLPRIAGTGKLMRIDFAPRIGLPLLTGPATRTYVISKESSILEELLELQVEAPRGMTEWCR